eukprot:jgi/Mesvir1/7076/Mv09187-RA.1
MDTRIMLENADSHQYTRGIGNPGSRPANRVVDSVGRVGKVDKERLTAQGAKSPQWSAGRRARNALCPVLLPVFLLVLGVAGCMGVIFAARHEAGLSEADATRDSPGGSLRQHQEENSRYFDNGNTPMSLQVCPNWALLDFYHWESGLATTSCTRQACGAELSQPHTLPQQQPPPLPDHGPLNVRAGPEQHDGRTTNAAVSAGGSMMRVSVAQRTLAIVKPDAGAHLGKIVDAIYRAGFTVAKMKMCRLSASDAAAFYEVHQGKPFFNTLVNYMSSGPITAMELVGEGAITRWRELIGPTDSLRAKVEAPNSLRAAFGTDITLNAVHGSDSDEASEQERRFFFSGPIGSCTRQSNSTCGLVKPHAVKEGVLGAILDQILSRFSITALEMFSLDRANANEFFEAYKGVVPEFNAMVDQLTSGPFVALEVSSDGGNPVNEFRDFAGPPDPEIARVLRPHTLRAQFGKDKVNNAIHATELEKDGGLEVSYFFGVLRSCEAS